MSIIQPVLTGAQITEITAYINNYRSLNQAPPLVWDANILIASNQWSQYLLTNNLFHHSGNPQYGENLAYFEGYGTDTMTLLKKSVDSWYNEISSYNFTKPGFSEATGHFTCLVWVASTKFAISVSIDIPSTEAYIVMNTSPPGNYIGKFDKNVLPPTSQQITPNNPTTLPVKLQSHKRIIFQELYNIVNAINTNQPKALIISIVNNIIRQINTYPNF
jgi:hypothetical protein